MTGSKDLVVDVQKIPSMPTNVEWGDASHSKVLGLGKVVISHDLTIEKVMLVESLAYNLFSVRQLALMGFATFFDIDTVALLWSKTLKVAFVGHVENGLYVINFSERPTKTATCLMAKVDVGWLWHRRLAHVNMRSLQSLLKGGHVRGLRMLVLLKIVLAVLVSKESYMRRLTLPRLSSTRRDPWSSFTWTSLGLHPLIVLGVESIAW